MSALGMLLSVEAYDYAFGFFFFAIIFYFFLFP